MNKNICALAAAVGSALLAAAAPAMADINVGISVCATGPGASLGIPEKNTVALFPTMIAGEKVNYIVLDDATDATQATKNARKFVSENNVDLIIGSSSVPPALAIAEVANESKTPQLSMSPIELAGDKNKWVFRTPQHNAVMAQALAEHMKANKVKTIGFIGYTDGYGEGWLKEMSKAAADAGMSVSVVERFNRTDTSVTGQVLRLVGAKPDVILVAASGTPSALPQLALLERGYKGQIYQTHGTATREFMRVGGKAVDGTILPVGPVVVAAQLPDSHPSKKLGLEYTRLYEEKYGAGSLSSFGAYAQDAYRIFAAAVPVALKKGKPGTPEFRLALRDAIESEKEIAGTQGVFNMTAGDHFGHDARSRVLVRVEKGDWKLINAQ
ncbi:ABC transporter substrate-binding protein [Undibacterium terreum]|uniref:Branched-chain amino acid ABC transporter substrate-binding protein n=1 Tax=Undibacterium terreum TaxID=1224302 RepID=A0A916XRS1_9BURK|nr:ABC transporter substrate-binding protein [Undibacterium terreum]GGC97704.1 branched-chain amino acid ABC transporter substrate-binding protein [Undibacterium terreum]